MFEVFKTHFKGVKIVGHEQKCCWNSSELFLHWNMWIYPWGEQVRIFPKAGKKKKQPETLTGKTTGSSYLKVMHSECFISDTSMGDSTMLLHYAWHCKEMCFKWNSSLILLIFLLSFLIKVLRLFPVTICNNRSHGSCGVRTQKQKKKKVELNFKEMRAFIVAKNKNISQMKEITRGETNIKLEPGKLSTWKLECLEQRAGNGTRRLRHTWLCHNCLFAVNADCMMHYRKSGSEWEAIALQHNHALWKSWDS